MSKSKKKVGANIGWFEIPADKPERAKKFYSGLFGWKITPFPGMADFWHIDTGVGDGAPEGSLMARKDPQQPIRNFVNVASVTKALAKVWKLGGTICVPKTAVSGMGWFAICRDTENNTFGFWEINKKAKKLS